MLFLRDVRDNDDLTTKSVIFLRAFRSLYD
jgi:hypothetical protein